MNGARTQGLPLPPTARDEGMRFCAGPGNALVGGYIHLPTACPLCGSATWWRSRSPVGPWICACCVEPLLEPDQIEWREAHMDVHP